MVYVYTSDQEKGATPMIQIPNDVHWLKINFINCKKEETAPCEHPKPLEDASPKLIGLRRLAARLKYLGVSLSWLRCEAESGRLPCLRVGKHRLIFDFDAVERHLLKRASEGTGEKSNSPNETFLRGRIK